VNALNGFIDLAALTWAASVWLHPACWSWRWQRSQWRRALDERRQRAEDARAGLEPPQSAEHARIRRAWRDAGFTPGGGSR
jgi:hypothetical protein